MTEVTLQLRGANADVITFDKTTFVVNPGVLGFGIPPTNVRIDPSAGVGGVFRHSRRGVRNIDLPVTVLGDTRTEVQTRLRRLAKITQDVRGPMTFKAILPDGDELFLRGHYTGGAETQWGGDTAGQQFCRWVLSFQVPQPYWESSDRQSFLVSGGGDRGLLPELTKLQVTSSEALGTVTVTSDADVEVFPLWTIEGPVTDFTADNGTQSFTITGTIDTGDRIIIDTEKKTVVDQDGVNRYDRLGPAPKLFSFPPGDSVMDLTGTDTTTDTSVRCEYALRYEVIH
jgi:hypothetical protein